MMTAAEDFTAYRTYELERMANDYPGSAEYWKQAARDTASPALKWHFTSNAVNVLIAVEGIITELKRRQWV